MSSDNGQRPTRREPVVGREVIAGLIKRLPNGPGVYRMIDAKGAVLYVGKARNLKKRVQSYARDRTASRAASPAPSPRRPTMEFVSTRTETEALLLEANLIKRLRPRFNVLLRDDKSFPYILITEDHPVPAIVKHRGARSRKGTYFGPFASAGAVGRTINALQRAFLLRTCSDSFYESRTRPCLLYQIKRCSAPCTGVISPRRLRPPRRRGEGVPVGQEPGGAGPRSRRRWRRRRSGSTSRPPPSTATASPPSPTSRRHQGINPRGIEEADVFACLPGRRRDLHRGVLLPHRPELGQPRLLSRAPTATSTRGAVLGAFLAQFYDDKPVPKLVLLSHEIEERALLEEALSEQSGHRISVTVPQRGEKKDLVDHALANAREALGRELAESASQQTLLAGLAERFGLAEPPQRIEVYDNSHIMGTNPVGAHDRRRAAGLRQGPVPQVQHALGGRSPPATTTP